MISGILRSLTPSASRPKPPWATLSHPEPPGCRSWSCSCWRCWSCWSCWRWSLRFCRNISVVDVAKSTRLRLRFGLTWASCRPEPPGHRTVSFVFSITPRLRPLNLVDFADAPYPISPFHNIYIYIYRYNILKIYDILKYIIYSKYIIY